MRHGRAKATRKTIQFFERTIGIKSPYHIILDGTFLVAVITYQIPIKDRLDKLVQHGNTYILHWTDSTMDEISKLCEIARSQKKFENVTILENAIRWGKENCQIISLKNINLERNTFPSIDQCYQLFNLSSSESKRQLSEAAVDIIRVTIAYTFASDQNTLHTDEKQENIQSIKQDRRHSPFFCASQDEELLDVLRHSGKVPVIRLARNSVLLLEQPSKYAQLDAAQVEKQKWKSSTTVSEPEKIVLKSLQEKQKVERKLNQNLILMRQRKQEKELYGRDTLMNSEYEKRKRSRKAKEPNPLSKKKRQKK